MKTKLMLSALLALCGVVAVSSAQAADFRCMVYSGADGTTLEKSTNKDGAYVVTAADAKAAEAGALKKAAPYKKGVTLTRAECSAAGTASNAEPAAAPTSTTAQPAGDTKPYYCFVYQNGAAGQMGLDHIPAPAGKVAPEDKRIWIVPVAAGGDSEQTAIALAKSLGKPAVDAMCEASAKSLMNP